MEWNERKAAIEMLKDLRDQGLESRYSQKMHGPMWELKTTARGGSKGGVRVYFLVDDDLAVLVHAEAKSGTHPNRQMLEDCLDVWEDLKK
jgi:hypothetical protein